MWKMKKEFNLSEKGKQHLVSFDNQLRTKFSERLLFEEEDVKEFIRLLKEDIEEYEFIPSINQDLFDMIDALAGEKLK